MLKFAGSALILVASIGLAYSIQMELKQHQKRLFELRSLLTKIFWEMNYSRRPVEMVLLYQTDTQDECLNEILKEIGTRLMKKEAKCGEDVWREVFHKYRRELGLNAEESELIEQAGRAFFGKSVEENQKILSLYQERLDFLMEVERKERKEKQKVYQTVCVMSGLVLIILLV